MASLEQFLTTGRLGPLHMWMTQDEAISVLGPAPDESVTAEPKILKYGGLQITFTKVAGSTENRLKLIGIYYGAPSEPVPNQVLPNDFALASETTVAEIRALLNRLGLKASEAGGPEELRLELSSGVNFIFTDGRLWSIQNAARLPGPLRKQISVSLPEETWKQLNTLARQSNRSVSEVCTEWLVQQASELPPVCISQ